MAPIQIRSPAKKTYQMFCGLYCWLAHNQTWCRKKKGVLAEATFPLSRSWKMMRPICSMQGETVPCRLTDFKAVRLCYVPPSLILGAAGGLFSGAQILTPHPLLALSHFPRYWQTNSSMRCFQDVFTLGNSYNRGPFHLQWSRLLCAISVYCILVSESCLGYHIYIYLQ